MGLFNRGQSISGMWLDGKPAIRAYLGDVLVWDGTTPAFVNVPRALASALVVAPAVRADASMTADRALGSSSAIAPSLTAFATVDPETAVIVTAQAGAPVVRADSIIMVETITVGAQALPAVAAQSSAATVAAPTAVVSVATPTPSVAAHFATTVPAIAVNIAAQVPVITATGAAVVNVPVSAVNAMARVPVASGNSSVVAFAVTADVSAKIPTLTSSSTVSAVKATATTLAPVPAVVANNYSPSGMTKNGNWVPTATAWTTIPGWTANAGSTVSGNGVVANGAKTGAVISGQLSNIYTGGGYIEVDVRLLLDGVVVKTLMAVITSTAAPTITITSDPLTVTSGQVATMQIGGTYATYATIQSGVNTYVRIT